MRTGNPNNKFFNKTLNHFIRTGFTKAAGPSNPHINTLKRGPFYIAQVQTVCEEIDLSGESDPGSHGKAFTSTWVGSHKAANQKQRGRDLHMGCSSL